MSDPFDRRRLLAAAGSTAAAALFGGRRLRAAAGKGDPTIEVLETRIISHGSAYHGWPTLFRRRNGELLLVCSGGREAHVCPFGRVELMRSSDDGRTWSWPRVLLDTAIDDRDAGGVETARGTLLVTTFTSLAYVPGLRKHSGATRARWDAAHHRLDDAQRQAELGCWMLRSEDGGVSWSKRMRVPVNSPHGPIQLADGRLLYAGKQLWRTSKRNGVCESADDGRTWTWLAQIPTRPGDRPRDYHELHAVEVTAGRIVIHIRNHNPKNSREILQCESKDGGRSWSVPHPLDVWGLPSHLMRLADGRLLMTYGHRRAPLGNQARVSADGGVTWSSALHLSSDGSSGDLGYPSTVQLEDGTLLTVWYEKVSARPRAVLRQARWRLQS